MFSLIPKPNIGRSRKNILHLSTLVLLVAIFLLPPVQSAMFLNETFDNSNLSSPNVWTNDDSGVISLNTTNPITGNQSGWERGAAWGYSYTTFTSAVAGNITISFKWNSYTQDAGFFAGGLPVGTWAYDHAFQLLCGHPIANLWGYYSGDYYSLNLTCNSPEDYNITAVISGLGVNTKMDLITNEGGANLTFDERGTATSIGTFGIILQQASSTALFDDICICSGTWNVTCCEGAAAPPASVSEVNWLSQHPSDITATSIFAGLINISYNYSNTTGITNTYLNYSVTSKTRSCIVINNGTCVIQNATFYQKTGINDTSADNQTTYNYTLGENDVLPVNNLLNYTAFNQTHNSFTHTSQSQLTKTRFMNVSNIQQYTLYESMTTGNCELYYCNSSYSTGNPSVSQYCSQFFSGTTNYNHSHSVYSNHSLFSLAINTSTGKIGGVSVTTESYIITRGTASGNCVESWINNLTSTGTYQNSSNSGATYSEITGTPDAHIHQFSNETLYYVGCQNKSGTINCSSPTQSDNYALDATSPTGANIITPLENADIYKYINLTFSKSISPANSTITYYNLSLLNNDSSFNQTISGNITRNYTLTNTTATGWIVQNQTYQDIVIREINGYIINSSAEAKTNSSGRNVTTRAKYLYIDGTTAYSDYNQTELTTYYTINYTNPYPYKKVVNYTLQVFSEFETGYAGYINNSIIRYKELINTTNNPSNISTIIDIHSLNISIGTYYLQIQVYDNESRSTNTTKLFNLTRDATLTTRLFYFFDNSTISNYTQNITDVNNGSIESVTTTTNTTEFYLIRGTLYESLIEALGGYSYDNATLNTSITNSSYLLYSAYIYTNNSVTINIYDSNNLTLINGTNITVKFTGDVIYTYIVGNGSLYVDGLTDGTWNVKFTAANYGIKTYTITVNNKSHQTLNAYLVSDDYSTTFTARDSSNTNVIENVSFTAELLNGTAYVVVESKYTDISGRVQMYYIVGEKYRFTFSKDGYYTKVFYLDPIIFSAYTVSLDKTSTMNHTSDYDLITVTYYPSTFLNNFTNNFTWLISSPDGLLVSYQMNISFPNGTSSHNATSFSGVNANGETFSPSFIITNASFTDRVNLTFSYSSTMTGTRNFAYSFDIIGGGFGLTNNTIARLKYTSYGMGMFEKAFLVMIVMVLICGFAYALTGMAGSLVSGLLVMGVAVYLGFLPVASILLSVIAGIFLIVANSTGGQR